MTLTFKRKSIKDDYRIGNTVLGVGVNGKVVECESIETGEIFALKILRDVPKARREVEIHVMACEHPNIVRIYDVYEQQYNGMACLFIVMERMSGGELFGKIQEKGRNAFAQKFDENVKQLVTACYTPYYCAPEILSSSPYGKAVDVWSIGVIMYILLSGYPPFYSSHGAPISPGMKRRIRAGQYEFPSVDFDRVSEAAKHLIRGCLKTDPAERITIDQVMQHKWLTHFNKNPTTPLNTCNVLREQRGNWEEMTGDFQEEMERTLASMRIDDVQIKQLDHAINDLLEKRKKKKAAEAAKS
ncbi:Non-specific serine/threonine protein kinase [Aphelenchoides fujianensis]|nr:Non-specific serine/threonine protein kinase [Aphelenchoides fujianensis]